MPRINVFGCSFSQGVPPKYYSWVEPFSDLVPDYDVYNYAVGGTSLLFHIHLIQTAKKRSDDINILQFTSSGRLTWWEPFEFRKYLRRSKERHNYVWLDSKGNIAIDKKIKRINLGLMQNTNHPEHIFAEMYYDRVTTDIIELEHVCHIKAASSLIDYGFFHRHNYWYGDYSNIIPKYDSFRDFMGEKDFNNLVYDNGDHLSLEGCKIEAEWVYNNLKERNLL